ncbi:olfactory receptor 10A6-like [Sardina pilchardus]|uniref:olfactory receptor 10A6-like n=1 Tax=Sardina pilchardus TaxID=27697 RepID=UPI002E0D115B
MNQSSNGVTLVLMSYNYMGSVKSVLFIVIFLVYVASLIANVVVMSLIYLDTTLHKPMFLFLFSLIVNGLIGSTAVWPNVMIILLTDDNKTSIEGCLIQAFLMITYGACNFSMLTVMAYDRFVSIFKPLQYHVIMNPQKVTKLLFVAHFLPAVFILGQICLSSQITLCKYTVHRIFCDNLSFYSLSCNDSFQNQISNLYGLCVFIVFGVLPLFLIILSYFKIIMLILKATRTARQKAFETCTPHLIIFINFSLASFFSVIYNRVSPDLPPEINIILSINYNLIPPLLHPIIYGIKNQEIKQSLAKIKRMPVVSIRLTARKSAK